MKTHRYLLASLFFALPALHAKDDQPTPPELQALAVQFIQAFKAGDQASMSACWHSPEILAAREAAEEAAERTTPLTAEEEAKEQKNELAEQHRDMEVSHKRAAKLRESIGKYFGDISKVELIELDLDEDDDAPAEAPVYDAVKLHIRAADGTHLILEVDDAVKLNGFWKFSGRVDDDMTLQLQSED